MRSPSTVAPNVCPGPRHARATPTIGGEHSDEAYFALALDLDTDTDTDTDAALPFLHPHTP